MNRGLKFIVISLLVVLVVWRFSGGMIRAAAHGPWFGWGGSWSGSGDDGSDSGPILTRDYSWSADRLELDVPGRVRFHPAPTWHLSIRGHEGTLNRLVVSDGQIREEDHGFCFFCWNHFGRLQVDLSGPALHEATLNGSGSIELQDLDQDHLQVRIRGSGTASGNGKLETLRLEIMGSGSANLAPLAETNADVTIDGSGDADVSPTGEARVTIAGSGDVRLHAHPAQLSTHVYGSGRISEVPGSPPAAAAAPAPTRGA
jgi:Putative auto-transporter adhesin, head GIN domain